MDGCGAAHHLCTHVMSHSYFHSSFRPHHALYRWRCSSVTAPVAYSSNAFPSRMSRSFAQRLTIPYTARSQNLCASVTVTLPSGAFTCVLDFCLACELPPIDVVLGLDWTNACGNANITIPPLSEDIGKLLLISYVCRSYNHFFKKCFLLHCCPIMLLFHPVRFLNRYIRSLFFS